MSGAEAALEAAMLDLLGGSAAVRSLLGDPVRVAEMGSPKPAYPFLEIVRHDSEPVSGAGFEASLHRVDLRVESRDPGCAAAREAIAAVRAALSGDEPELEGWRCVFMAPVFSDFVQMRFGFWRALLRVKAIVEPD